MLIEGDAIWRNFSRQDRSNGSVGLFGRCAMEGRADEVQLTTGASAFKRLAVALLEITSGMKMHGAVRAGATEPAGGVAVMICFNSSEFSAADLATVAEAFLGQRRGGILLVS